MSALEAERLESAKVQSHILNSTLIGLREPQLLPIDKLVEHEYSIYQEILPYLPDLKDQTSTAADSTRSSAVEEYKRLVKEGSIQTKHRQEN